jgi:glyoxylase-like metal-dependent hydrolase (beta-lactamase superfamily II)
VAVAALVSEEIAVPDTGSTRADLFVLIREAVELYRGALAGRLMPNLIGAMARKPELARSVRDGFLAGRRAALGEVLRRGVERGDLRPDLDLDEILVTRTELEYGSGLRGRLRGYVANKRWPAWFRPTVVELEPDPFGPFPQGLRLTEAGDVALVPLPGHTPGQIGVLVDEGDQNVFLAADSSATQELMLRGKVDGVGADEQAERLTHERIRAFAAETPTVYLVAHDPGTGARLAERRLVHPIGAEVAA